jgi:hypothetical protein
MYTSEIIWFISWPVFIWVNYKITVWTLQRLEKRGSLGEG